MLKLHETFDEFIIRENRELFRMPPDQAKAFSETLEIIFLKKIH